MSTLTTTMKLVAPDVNDKKGKTIEDLAANFQYLDALFPIGTIYESTKPTNPGTFRGGTWTQLDGRMLVGAGTTFPAGSTGGEKEHVLSSGEMPPYKPVIRVGYPGSGNKKVLYFVDSSDVEYLVDEYSQNIGSGTAHNNMPPYRSVYMWERTA